MKGNGLDVAAALRTIASEDTAVRVQRVAVTHNLGQTVLVGAFRLIALGPVSFLVMLVLGELHAAGTGVPALGYLSVLNALVAAWLLVTLFRRPRWYG